MTALALSTLLSTVGLLSSEQSVPAGPPATPPADSKAATTENLGGANRALTLLSTDKPIYRSGDTVYIRGVLLASDTRKPIPDASAPFPTFDVLGPKGETIFSGRTEVKNSVLGFAWTVPDGQAGGEYKVVVKHLHTGFAPAERTFEVRAYRAPRLKNQIVFLRDGYGPGDTVSAILKTERAEGGIPAGAQVTVLARVDGQEVHRGQAAVDAQGQCAVSFPLPAKIARGEGTLALVIEDGGVLETASKTLPILLQTVDLQLYPEGGELIAGLPNRVYLEARTPAQKPADLAGIIVDSQGRTVAEVRTAHEGRGRFELTPLAGETYTLKITEPAGITSTYPLPKSLERGAVLQSVDNAVATGQPVKFRVGSSHAGRFQLILAIKEVTQASQTIDLRAGQILDVMLTPPATAAGVLRATLLEQLGQDGKSSQPRAERLVFRQPEQGLRVSVHMDRSSYTPGAPAKLTIRTTNADGKPVAAVVGVTVTDDSVLEMIEKREQAPRLPAMFYLEPDVRELADAHVYLDSENPKAPQALDLLLGTQGWRRFAFLDPVAFLKQHEDAARRTLALKLVTRDELMDFSEAIGGGGARAFANGAALPPGAMPKLAAVPMPPPGPVPNVVAAPAPVAAAVPAQIQDPAQGQPAPQPSIPQPSIPVAKAQEAVREQLEQFNGDARARGLLRDEFARRRIMPGERWELVAVREYAHQVRPDRQPGQRSDFTETLYWNAGVVTNTETGTAEVRFGLNDSVSSFRVALDGFDNDGSLAAATEILNSVQPFYLEPKLPLEVTSGDSLLIPLALVNGTTEPLPASTIAGRLQNGPNFNLATPALGPQIRGRVLARLTVAEDWSGTTQFEVQAKVGPYADQVTRSLIVKPLGFPQEVAGGGMLAADGTAEFHVALPQQLVAHSLKAEANVFPTPLASMTQALERLIQEPCGCFEQTSSSTYPLVMAQQYFLSHTGIDPLLITRSQEMLDKGYQRLAGYECSEKGYEWFGENPGHEALTAFGLMEFSDMAQVREVNSKMLDRTRDWLLKTRDGQGNFTRARRALHTWIDDKDCSNAYITWALLESNRKTATELTREIATLKEAAKKSSNSYVLGLVSNVLFLSGDDEGGRALAQRLAKLQTPSGLVEGGTTTIVGSQGESLNVETTSLALLAWLRDAQFTAQTEQGIKYLSEVCKGGRFGTTQSTVLALRAIVAYDQSRARPKAPGSVTLLVDGRMIGQPVPFTVDTQGTIALPDFAAELSPGKHVVTLKMNDGSEMPYTLRVTYNTIQPASSEACKLHLDVKLRDAKIEEGGVTEAQVVVINRTNEAVPTPLAIIGLPGGLEVRHDQLKELVRAKRIAAYEVLGREVVLYWRELKAEERVELPLSLVAALPGTYTGPASRAYLYYADEAKNWVGGLRAEITPRGQE